MTERQNLAKDLAGEGKTYAEIGRILRVSRQRAHQLLTGYKSPAHIKSKRKKTKKPARA